MMQVVQKDKEKTKEAVLEAFKSFLHMEIKRQQNVGLVRIQATTYTLEEGDERPSKLI